MSKSIYNKPIESVQILSSLINLKELNSKKKLDMLTQIEEALKQAKKQEKDLKWQNENADDLCIRYTNTNELLKLYKELATVKDDVIHSVMFGKDYEHLRVKAIKIEKQIKEIENNE